MKPTKKQTRRLIVLAGGPAVVGRALGITSQAVSQWTCVPPEHCLAIEEAVGGRVTRYDLRPDIYGHRKAA